MALTPAPVKGKRKSEILCNAFAKSAPKSARGFVFYGVNASNFLEWRTAQRHPDGFWAIDNSYFDKTRGNVDNAYAQFRITRNAMQIRAVDHQSDGKRFDALGVEVKPWRDNPDGHWLLVSQSTPFMCDIALDPNWRQRALDELMKTGRIVRVRDWSANKSDAAKTLAADLENAHMLVTYSSAAAVEALIAGVQTRVEPMSALHGALLRADRLRILAVLADNMWTFSEITSGAAWRWLSKNEDGSVPMAGPATGP